VPLPPTWSASEISSEDGYRDGGAVRGTRSLGRRVPKRRGSRTGGHQRP